MPEYVLKKVKNYIAAPFYHVCNILQMEFIAYTGVQCIPQKNTTLLHLFAYKMYTSEIKKNLKMLFLQY